MLILFSLDWGNCNTSEFLSYWPGRYLASSPSVTETLSTSADTGNFGSRGIGPKRDRKAMLISCVGTLEQAGKVFR